MAKLTLPSLDLDHEALTSLTEDYSVEKEPDDGEIYRKIRCYQNEGNSYFEDRWWAILSAISIYKKKHLKRLIDHRRYKAAFDVQLDIPGLGGGMRLSTLHKMFAMRCDDVRCHALRYFRKY
jgi:Protein of unknown function (DUF3723)